jgi:hypothetical protein
MTREARLRPENRDMMRHRAALVLLGAALLALTTCNGRRPAEDAKETDSDEPQPPGKPTLAVLVVVDQLRGDMPKRWRPLFVEGGFRRLATQGAWYQACHYPYASTVTGAGHATVATGCSPDAHGIIANDWFSAREGKVYCVSDERYLPVPAPLPDPPSKASSDKQPKGVSPERLLAPTLGDALKAHTNGKGKVVALSLKDRSAVLPAGRSSPDAVYWADKDGRFVTSLYYRDSVHGWVRDFNASGAVDRWLGKEWVRSRGDVDYEKWAGPDDVAGEANVHGLGRTFPHPLSLGEGKSKGKRNYYAAVATSPMGNDLLLELVKRAIDAEKLGRRSTPDFLAVSFSSNDLVGHAFGPDSQEVLDVTLRTDVILRDLMSYLDEKVGKGRWVLALTADHGVCPLPEVAKDKDAKRWPEGVNLAAAEKELDRQFPAQGGAQGKGKWIESSVSNMLYLSRDRIRARGVAQADVERALAAWLRAQPFVMDAFTRAEIVGRTPLSVPALAEVRRSYREDRSGDVTFVTRPYHIMGKDWAKGGTTHGSPHDYDRHVPLMVIGPGVKRGVREKERVSPELAAVILAKALGMEPPAKAAGGVPRGLFGTD